MNAPPRGDPTLAKAGRLLGRAVTWPIRRVLDSRFGGLSEQIATAHASTVERLAAVQAQLQGMKGRVALGAQRAHVERACRDRLTRRTLDDIDEDLAHLLNYAESHTGFAAQRQLWFNPPLSLEYKPRDVRVSSANERIAEIPYTLRALADTPAGARVLDVGATESTLAFSLASLGYRTTALDVRRYPLSHPLLEVVVAPIEDWQSSARFDAAVCLSTLEHVGLGVYGQAEKEEADVKAMRRIRELVVPRGLLVLTVPVGTAAVGETERTYDRTALEQLLDGWETQDFTVIRQERPTVWTIVEGGDWEQESQVRQVGLVTARRQPEKLDSMPSTR